MTLVLTVSIVAAGLAVLLAREARLRRALEVLCTTLIRRRAPRRRPGSDRTARARGRSRFVLVIICLCAGAAAEAQAGWFSWLWGEHQYDELKQALAVANEAADAATRAVDSQSRQAAAQAEQNSRVAALLGELSQERQSLSTHLTRFAEAGHRDSAIAAAVLSVTPALLSATALMLGGVALWAVTRPGPAGADASSALIGFLIEHGAASRQPGHSTLGREATGARRLRAQRVQAQLPEPDRTGTAPPF